MDSKIIDSLKKQLARVNSLLKNPKIESRKSWKATNITLLDSLFGKNNEYSREFQKMDHAFLLSWYWIINEFELKDYRNYITTWESIILSALDVYESAGESVINWSKTKTASKKSQTINVNNNNIINQTQTVNIDIENSLKNELTVKQYEKLNVILQDKNKKTKWEKLKEFLLQLWSETLAKILKDILLWN